MFYTESDLIGDSDCIVFSIDIVYYYIIPVMLNYFQQMNVMAKNLT